MTLEEMKKYIQQKKLEVQLHSEDEIAKKEHLKRQYLRLHHMERKLQVMKMMAGKEY